MKLNITFFTFVLAAFLSITANAATWQENKSIAELFTKGKANGTFVLYDVTDHKLIGYNQPRAKTRYIPASTYKIPNSLIGLSVGAAKNVDEVFPYDGKPYSREVCVKDMNMREAIKLSCVPYYQELARRIGLERMQAAVKKLDYGNEDIGKKVDQFWLDGPLKISAIEQTQFLAKLAQKTLPFPIEAQESVHEIARLDQGKDWVLYGKTGWTGTDKPPHIGWWVGWVTKGKKTYTFALNMDMTRLEQGQQRIDIGRAALKELRILD